MSTSISPPVPRRNKTKKLITAAVASLAAAALLGAPVVMSTQAQAAPGDLSEAQAQVLRSDLLKAPLANLGYTKTGNPSNPGPENGTLDVGLLADESVNLGAVQVPLFGAGGLVNLGGLGALNSYSESATPATSRASSGVIGQNGAISVSPEGGVGADPAYVDLSQVLDQLNVSGLTDQVLDQARIEIGAFASEAAQENTVVTSSYAIAGLKLKLRSPLLATLPGTLESSLNQAVTPINNLVSGSGALNQLLNTLKSTIENGSIPGVSALRVDSAKVSLDGLDSAVQSATKELIGSPIGNPSGSVLVDLSTGTISLDLAKLLKESGGGDLNSLPPNTELLSDRLIKAVRDGIADSLQGLTTRATDALTKALSTVKITMVLGVSAGCVSVLGVETCVAKGNVTVTGSLADFSGTSGKSPAVSTTLAAAGIDFGSGINDLIKPVIDTAISSTTGPLVKTAIATATDQLPVLMESVTDPILNALQPVLDQVLARVASVTINEQPTEAPLNSSGDLGAGSFTVRALSVRLLPGDAASRAAKLSLASSTVKVTKADDGNVDSNADAGSSANANANSDSDANTAANANAGSSANANANSSGNPNAAANANANGASNGSGSSKGSLAATGSNDPAPFLIGAALFLLLGAALVAAALSRRSKVEGTSSKR